MHLRHILAAMDRSEAGRDAARTAIDLATRCSARLTILHVASHRRAPLHAEITRAADESDAAVASLRRWLETEVVAPGELERIQLEAAVGVPAIEICRLAESDRADLVVLGRKHSADMPRLLLGDTADAVARRSPVPTLFVPRPIREPGRVLVALDGSPRVMVVLQEASDFARSMGADLEVVTVEGAPGQGERDEPAMPAERSRAVQSRAGELLSAEGFPGKQVAIRRGDVVESVIAHCLEMQADVLVIGYHRGAAPSILGAGSTAQRLGHAAPCAVLTVPL